MSLNLTALLVEHDEATRLHILNLLQPLYFQEIYIAKNGGEGVVLYQTYHPDIILTNYNIPGLNGLDMSVKIKEDNSQVPIIFITEIDQANILQDAINIGIDAYIFQPIKVEQFLDVINRVSKQVLLQRHLKNKHKLLEEYKRAIDASAAVTKTDTNGVITYVNDAFCYLSGYSQEELVGKRHNLVRHPDTPDEVYRNMWGTITSKQVWKGRIKNVKKTGETYYEYSVIVPILNEEDEIVEYIAIRQDITDLYLQEEYLKKRIQEEIEKNTALHKQHEEQSIREEKFATIGKMAAGITHEINTPLTYIKGNLEIMLADLDAIDDSIKQKSFLKEDIQTVLEGVDRIASIVESMREMAAQAKEPARETNIYACLITALTLSNNKAKQITKIYLQNELFDIGLKKDRFSFNACVQKQRIEQMFIIIINNALDALKRIDDFEARTLFIEVSELKEDIVVRFKDTGTGIDEAILPHIFDPFQSDKEEGGMGIGLNVAKRIVDDHGGKIVPSNYENGAIFDVYIPKTFKHEVSESCYVE